MTSDTWVQDLKGESFIFSLTNNDKFFLNNKNNAILLRKSKDFIYFGNG